MVKRTESVLDSCGLLLFVPGNRPDRFAKAGAAGADAVIIDLEDAVAAPEKDRARQAIEHALSAISTTEEVPFLVRINAVDTPWHEADVEAVARLRIEGVILPKAERVTDLVRLSQTIGGRERVIALVETARGLASVRDLAAVCGRVAFGSIDFAADIGAEHTRETLLHARAELVLASRLAGLPAPIDGVTASISAAEEVETDARYAASLGFSGKLLIHPQQVAPAVRGFQPVQDEIRWAQRVMAASAQSAVSVVNGGMVDAPVRARAEWILRRAQRSPVSKE